MTHPSLVQAVAVYTQVLEMYHFQIYTWKNVKEYLMFLTIVLSWFGL